MSFHMGIKQNRIPPGRIQILNHSPISETVVMTNSARMATSNIITNQEAKF